MISKFEEKINNRYNELDNFKINTIHPHYYKWLEGDQKQISLYFTFNEDDLDLFMFKEIYSTSLHLFYLMFNLFENDPRKEANEFTKRFLPSYLSHLMCPDITSVILKYLSMDTQQFDPLTDSKSFQIKELKKLKADGERDWNNLNESIRLSLFRNNINPVKIIMVFNKILIKNNNMCLWTIGIKRCDGLDIIQNGYNINYIKLFRL